MATHSVLDADTARDVQIKLALAKENRKLGFKTAAYEWVRQAERSLDEFKQSQIVA
jgi:hypothetical protein